LFGTGEDDAGDGDELEHVEHVAAGELSRPAADRSLRAEQHHRAGGQHHRNAAFAGIDERAEKERFHHHGKSRVTLGLLGPRHHARGDEVEAQSGERDGKNGDSETFGDQRGRASEQRPNRERSHAGILGFLRVILLPGPLPDEPD
jgi:hypothetical protein